MIAMTSLQFACLNTNGNKGEQRTILRVIIYFRYENMNMNMPMESVFTCPAAAQSHRLASDVTLKEID